MSVPRELPSKKEVALMLLESADVFIHLDPRKEQVVVPPWLRKQPHLILQVGLNMPVAIPDLDVDDEGVTCTLSFNRSPFWCKLPWSAIYALVSKDARGMVWPDDVPPEVAVKFVKQDGAAAATAPEQPAEPVAAAPAPEPSPEPPPAARGKGRKGAGRKKRAPERQAEAAAAMAPVPAETVAQAPAAKPRRELPPYLRVIK